MIEKLTMKRYNKGPYFCYRIPGIVCTESGKLLAYCESRQSGSDWAEIDITLQTSTDGGKTWSPDVIIDRGSGKTTNNPVMIVDGKELTLLWQKEYHRTFCSKSYDEGETWETPVEITESLRTPEYAWTVIACGPGHGIKLKNGRYVVPVWLACNPENPKAHAPSIVSTIYSDDKGKTWNLGELIRDDWLINPSETMLAQLPDGTVCLNSRNECPDKKRFVARSQDGASGWYDKHLDDTLIDPTCMAGLVEHNGILYFSNCHSQTARANLCVHKSVDGGKTWENIACISEPAGYSDIALSPDGKKIYVFFEEFDAPIDHWDLVLATVDNSVD